MVKSCSEECRGWRCSMRHIRQKLDAIAVRLDHAGKAQIRRGRRRCHVRSLWNHTCSTLYHFSNRIMVSTRPPNQPTNQPTGRKLSKASSFRKRDVGTTAESAETGRVVFVFNSSTVAPRNDSKSLNPWHTPNPPTKGPQMKDAVDALSSMELDGMTPGEDCILQI